MHNSITKHFNTAAGILSVVIINDRITQATFESPISDQREILTLVPPIVLQGTGFQCKVWQAAISIPAGTTRTYQEVAAKIGKPKAFRAVAHALGANKIAFFVPCHRVVRKDGTLGGYKWGVEKKIALLQAEK